MRKTDLTKYIDDCNGIILNNLLLEIDEKELGLELIEICAHLKWVMKHLKSTKRDRVNLKKFGERYLNDTRINKFKEYKKIFQLLFLIKINILDYCIDYSSTRSYANKIYEYIPIEKLREDERYKRMLKAGGFASVEDIFRSRIEKLKIIKRKERK